MSAPIISSLAVWTPLAVLLASLLGSAHCAAMCGGLVTSVCKTRGQWVRYQAGRLLAYAFLGAVAGAIGKSLLTTAALGWLAWGAALSMALTFVMMGVRVWQGRVPHLKLLPSPALAYLYRHAGQAPVLLGALSAVLPCGWLQSYVLAAAATQSRLAGSLLMAVFWIGTLPALAATPWAARQLVRPFLLRAPRFAAILLIAAGLAGVGVKMSALFAATETPAPCHTGHAPK